MTPRRRAVLATLLALITMAALAHAQGKPLKLRIAVHTQTVGAPDVIAIRQGYFKQEGLDVEWRRFALGK